MNKYEIEVDGTKFLADNISFEYSQLDNDSERSDDGTMTRDVIGLINKVYCDFFDDKRIEGAALSRLLKLIKTKKSCTLKYFDVAENAFITKPMYIVADTVKVRLIDDEFIAEPFQMRFIQMNVDEI